jgi:hypothetical protein
MEVKTMGVNQVALLSLPSAMSVPRTSSVTPQSENLMIAPGSMVKVMPSGIVTVLVRIIG